MNREETQPRRRPAPKKRILVVGAGIAGLSAAWRLSASGEHIVELIEAERFVFSRSSGLNAAIYRPLEEDAAITELAARSQPLLRELAHASEVPLLEQRGLLLLYEKDSETEIPQRNAHASKFDCQKLNAPWEMNALKGLRLSHPGPGLFSPEGGVLDPHAIGQALVAKVREQGCNLHLDTKVRRLIIESGRCRGVQLTTGTRITADDVVLATGASSGRLGYEAGSPLPLINLQRHLCQLQITSPLDARSPVVWRLKNEVYLRAESGGVLASPCDETPTNTDVATASLEAIENLGERLNQLSNRFSDANLQRFWACIRTKAPDNRPIIGPDPTLTGLHWITALGGFGMSCGLAAGEALSNSLLGKSVDSRFAPSRFRHQLPTRQKKVKRPQ